MKNNLQKFGKILKELRIKKGMSLRDVYKEIGYDPSNWSKIERGIISPPAEEKTLLKWAQALGLDRKKNELREFIDDAQVAQGIIPQDIMSSQNAVKALPAFFRTLRNEKPTKKEIDNLVGILKNS